ncbi:hypothetical protein GURASL_04410 [Geotalea uraniireducens]|uniref:Type-F conjugative transfer system protein TraW n=1 Tax=Geotalea uraniireducens TaxID=351604 RepID=A0ABM8EGH8_9BACT|nr:hypothetical protein [Geotalea uraniireducens]BDV41518.1 hypothetical protein GURASL_04410 [Geotalea uraniireducens]
MKGVIVMATALFVATTTDARNLSTVGATYQIAERDALTEIEQRAKGVDWSKVVRRKAIEDYDGPQDRVLLPRAAKDRRFPVDMTWTLATDIPDGKGGVLYPQGYTFNPLDYITFTKTLVVINGNDPAQVKWFASSEYNGRIDVMLLLTEGYYRSLGKRLDVPLFYADGAIVDRLRLEAVPSIVRQEGKVMVVNEFAVPR